MINYAKAGGGAEIHDLTTTLTLTCINHRLQLQPHTQGSPVVGCNCSLDTPKQRNVHIECGTPLMPHLIFITVNRSVLVHAKKYGSYHVYIGVFFNKQTTSSSICGLFMGTHLFICD